MADAPYPLLTQDALERRLENTDEYRLQLGLSDSQYDQLLTDIIEEESAFVARELAAQGVDFSEFADRATLTTEYPEARRAMVRLCRASLSEIQEDGLEKEKIGDHSESYTAPGAIRADVQAELAMIDVPTDDDGDGTPDSRVTMI